MMGKLHMFMSIFYVFCIIYAGRVIMHMHIAVGNSRFDLVFIYFQISGIFFVHDLGSDLSQLIHCNNMAGPVIVMTSSQ